MKRLLFLVPLFVIALGLTGCPEAEQMMGPVIADEPADKVPPTMVGAVKEPMEEPTDQPVEPSAEEPGEPMTQPETEDSQPGGTLPPGYELPADLIPTEPTVLSADEQALIVSDEWAERDGTAVKLQTQAGKTADIISLLPYKDREEVYALFVASIDLPFFAEASEKVREINLMRRKLWIEYERTGDLGPWQRFNSKALFELRIPPNRRALADIYFEENPQDVPYRSGHSYYWIYLEWYRLQLEHGRLPEDILLDHFRQSAKKGYIQGLDNPFD